MSRRDPIEEILAKKQRTPDWRFPSSDIYKLESSFRSVVDRHQHDDPVIRSLFLAGITACIEVAVRDAIRELIDHGSPYLDRVSELKQHLRFEFEITKALYARQVSFGDLVAHLLPVSAVEHITTNLGILLGGRLTDSFAQLQEFVEPPESTWFPDSPSLDSVGELGIEGFAEAAPPNFIVADVNGLMATIGRLFSARHVMAHEASFNAVSTDDLRQFFEAANSFTHALSELVAQTLYPGVPRTSFGMSFYAMKAAEEAENEMNAAYGELLQILEGQDSECPLPPAVGLRTAQEAFSAYLNAEGEFQCSRISTASGNALRFQFAIVHQELMRERTHRLRATLAEEATFPREQLEDEGA